MRQIVQTHLVMAQRHALNWNTKMTRSIYVLTINKQMKVSNAASSISSGRKESAVKLNARLDQFGILRVEAVRTEDSVNEGVRHGVSASIEKAINRIVSLELGARYYNESANASCVSTQSVDTPYDGTTVRAKLKTALPFDGSSAFLEYEQDIADSDRRVFAVGGDAQVYKNIHAYARHEFISSIGGLYELNDTQKRNTTVFGLDSEYKCVMVLCLVNIVYVMV